MNVSELLAIPSIQLTDGTYQPNSIPISDTNVNLSSNAPAILALRTLVSDIYVTGVHFSRLTVADALSLTSLLSLMRNPTIEDTTANLVANAPAILALDTLISRIYVSDGITVAHALSLTSLLPLMRYPTISDTAANLVANAPAILEIGTLIWGINVIDVIDGLIDVSDGLTVANALSLTTLLPLMNDRTISDTAANVLSHAIELSLLGTDISIRISDTTANLVANAPAISALGALVARINVTDGLTVAHSLSLKPLLSLMIDKTIHDVATNVLNHAIELGALGANVQVIITDTTTNLANNAQAILALSTLVSRVYVSDGLTVAHALSLGSLLSLMDYPTISDTLTNLASNAPAILALGALVSRINVTDGPTDGLVLTVAHVLSFKSLLSLMDYPTISDTAANLASNAPAILEIGTLISRINVTDGLTVAHALSLTSLLPLMGGITINDSAANVLSHANELASLGANIHVIISDTPANLLSHVSAILGLGTLISGVWLGELNAMSASSLTALQPILSKIQQLSIVDTAINIVSHASILTAMSNPTRLHVVDTAANVISQASFLADLNCVIDIEDTATNIINQASVLSNINFISHIFVVDTVANVLTNASTLNALGLYSSLCIKIFDTAANIADHALILKDLHSAINFYYYDIEVKDTAANVINYASALALLDYGSLSSILLNITVTDNSVNLASHASTLLALNLQQPIHVEVNEQLTIQNALLLTPLLPLMMEGGVRGIGGIRQIGWWRGEVYPDIIDTAVNVINNASALASAHLSNSIIVLDTYDNVRTNAAQLFGTLDYGSQITKVIFTDITGASASNPIIISANYTDSGQMPIFDFSQAIGLQGQLSVTETVLNVIPVGAVSGIALTISDSNGHQVVVDVLSNQLNYNPPQMDINNVVVLDVTPPSVTSFSPFDGATAVAVDSNIALTFSEAIQKGTGFITLHADSAGGVVVESFNAASSPRLVFSGSSLTIDPTADLSNNTHYFVTFDAGSVKDLAGNNYAGTTTYDFTTAPALDITAPTVTSFSPVDGATAVAIGSNIDLTFSETIQKGTGTIAIHAGSAIGTILESFDAATSNLLSISGNTLTINPLANLANNTQYFVTFDSGSVKDIAGNIYAGITTYDFTTVLNTINGKTGNDKLVGTNASDILNGGKGADSMKGGLGSDTYYVDNTGDKVIESKSAGTDTVYSSISFIL